MTNATTPTTPDLADLLQSRFGFPEFRRGQRKAVEELLEHGRLLCIQPTGHGKSLLYQLPAVLLEGMTLVLSPLLALVRDQVGQLTNRFDIPAAAINSDQTDEENERVREEARVGRIKVLFIAPEQLDNLVTRELVTQLPVDLFVVDEAHCISTWGHDFRPAYRQIVSTIAELTEQRPEMRVLGLTATANSTTEKDIAAQLGGTGGQPLKIRRASMDRSNIALSVHSVDGFAAKLDLLERLLRDMDGTGILYCATRENTELAAEYLQEKGLDVVSYHAGYAPERKRELQQAFMDSKHKAIAATNALGMGIDKSDVRFIAHVDVPGSITAYYQEVGRAGRDGDPARGILLFDPDDLGIQEHFARSAQPTPADFDKVLAAVVPGEDAEGPSLTTVKVATGLHPTRVNVVLAELQEQGFVEKRLSGRRQVYVRTGTSGTPELTRYTRQAVVRARELEAMQRYARGEVACLMHELRTALGDEESAPCGRCCLCKPEADQLLSNTEQAERARSWLAERPANTPAWKRLKLHEGLAVLDGRRKTQTFRDFMRHRDAEDHASISDELERLVHRALARLKERHDIGAVVPVPSRSWCQRRHVGEIIAHELGATLYPDLLIWRREPETRQGDLLNNDQRAANVKEAITVSDASGVRDSGAILLLDDFCGSSHTLREAARALRKDGGAENELVPLTIALVQWRLGAAGMI